MRDISSCWMDKDIQYKYIIEKLKRTKNDILEFGEAYAEIFNGAPFYESWDIKSARKVLLSYLDDDALVLSSRYKEKIIGFLVAVGKVPEEQQKFVQCLENIKFIEEIGVLSDFRGKMIASEMIRVLLLEYLNTDDRYIGYRTNAMRYFAVNDSESFESALARVQKEDRIKRMSGESIYIPEFSYDEKQAFINKYIEVIKNRPELDVSNSNALFRSIFGDIDYSTIDGNYSFQTDPTGDGNDRIFPVIDLSKKIILTRGGNISGN